MSTGGILTPTMWCLVTDKLLRLLSEAGFFTRAYVDNVIIVIIAVNPEEVDAVLFTRKYKTSPVS